MNIINILEGIEKLVIELLLWMIFIPKTLFKIISDPNWISDYVEEELAKKSDRFENYISPIILFLVSSLVLFVIASQIDIDNSLNNIVNRVDSDSSSLNAARIAAELQKDSNILAGLGFLSLPLLFSLATELFRGIGLTRKGIQRIMYIQCYYFSPLTLSFFAFLLLISLLPEDEFVITLSAFLLAIVIFILFLIIEVKLIATELKSGIWKAIGILFGSIIVILVAGIFILSSVAVETSEIDAAYEGGLEQISDLRLPSNGEFSISVRGYEGSAGTYRLALTKASETVAKNYLNQQGASFPTSGSLEYDQFVDSKVTQDNATSTWTFTGDEGDIISISVMPETEFDVLFDVLNAEGKSILKEDQPNYTMGIGILYVLLIGAAVILGIRSLFRKSQKDVKQGEKN